MLAALAGPSHPGAVTVVIAQAPTDGAKSTKPATARALLESLDLRDVTVTADALHTVKATAKLVHQQGGQFVLPAKENRPAFVRRAQRPALGRRSDRSREHRDWARPDHPPHHPGPARPTRPVVSARQPKPCNFIRDTCYREDHSRVRTRSGPRVLASLSNLAINALRLAGRTDITEATCWANRDMTRPFTILGITG